MIKLIHNYITLKMVSIINIKKLGLGNKPNSRIKMMKREEARNLDKEIKMAYL